MPNLCTHHVAAEKVIAMGLSHAELSAYYATFFHSFFRELIEAFLISTAYFFPNQCVWVRRPSSTDWISVLTTHNIGSLLGKSFTRSPLQAPNAVQLVSAISESNYEREQENVRCKKY